MTKPKRKAVIVKKYNDEYPDKVIFRGSLEEAKKVLRRQDNNRGQYELQFQR